MGLPVNNDPLPRGTLLRPFTTVSLFAFSNEGNPAVRKADVPHSCVLVVMEDLITTDCWNSLYVRVMMPDGTCGEIHRNFLEFL